MSERDYYSRDNPGSIVGARGRTRSPSGEAAPAPFLQIWRFKVAEHPVLSGNPAPYVRAHVYDGTTEGTTDYYVQVFSTKAVGAEIFAAMVEGGTGKLINNDATRPVQWTEVQGIVSGGTTKYQVLQVLADTPDIVRGWDWVRAHA